MITDLVRNDLGRISRPGTVTVTELLQRQEHPGLAHLVSTVQAGSPPTTVGATSWPPPCPPDPSCAAHGGHSSSSFS